VGTKINWSRFTELFRRWQCHPDRDLQPAWMLLQLAILLLPFSSLLGTVGTLLAAILVWGRRGRSLFYQPISLGLAGISGWMVLSCLFAPRPGDALLGLFNFLPFFFVLPGLATLIQTPAHLRRLTWILVLGAIPVIVVGLGQQFLGWAGRLHLLWLVVDVTVDPTGNPPGRMSSVFFYANVLATYLTVLWILGLGLGLEGWLSRAGVRKSARVRNIVLRTGWLGGVAIALVFTHSRNAWIIAVLAGLAFAVYAGWRWLAAVVGAIAALVMGAAFAPAPLRDGLRAIVSPFFWARLTDELFPNRPLATLRTTQWQFAWDLSWQRPLTGWGLRSFPPLYQMHTGLWMGHPHNLWLMLSAETGLLTTIGLTGLVGWILFQASRELGRSPECKDALDGGDRPILFTWLATFLGLTLFYLSDVTLFDVRINVLGWLILAGIHGVTQSTRLQRERPHRQ